MDQQEEAEMKVDYYTSAHIHNFVKFLAKTGNKAAGIHMDTYDYPVITSFDDTAITDQITLTHTISVIDDAYEGEDE